MTTLEEIFETKANPELKLHPCVLNTHYYGAYWRCSSRALTKKQCIAWWKENTDHNVIDYKVMTSLEAILARPSMFLPFVQTHFFR